ncbi:MAG: vanadium-dependent haloperoxidase [Gaiellaceae bacterium]
MRVGVLVASAVALTLAAQPAAPHPAAVPAQQDQVAARWIGVTLQEIAAHRVNPPRAARALALVSVAMHDAAAFAAPAEDRAVAAAASTVLAYVFPDRAAAFRRLAGRAAPRSKAAALGRRVGRRIVERARNDGAGRRWRGGVPTGPGLWTPTPPAFDEPLEPLAGTWRSWNLVSGSQLRPGPPPPVSSERYRAAMREVYDVSLTLTEEQKRIATRWAGGPGTVTPPGLWNQIALTLLREARTPTQRSTRILKALNTAQADAFIACWDAKYTYWSERPVTAIRREIDPRWLPLLPTPPFPSYVSGHATTSGAASEVLAHFLPRRASRVRALAEQATASRLYGGIHFRFDNEVGLDLGREVARLSLRR